MNILIIDDREYDALELSTKVQEIDFEATIKWRSCPDKALEEIVACDDDPFDLVFVDQHMPGILGTDLVKQIGKVLNPTTRVIMLTSDGGDSTRAKALVNNCDGFLTKPVDVLRLRTCLDGSRCRWEPDDLPSNIELYWRLLDDGPQSRIESSADQSRP